MTTIEQLAGVPSAEEINRLANALFPDLAGNVQETNNAGHAEEYSPVVERANTQAAAAGHSGTGLEEPAAAEQQAFRWEQPTSASQQGVSFDQPFSAGQQETGFDQPTAELEHPAVSQDEFDWEHPFAYGGGSTDPWLSSVEAGAAPESDFLASAGDVPTVTSEPVSYSPVVLSQEQAAAKSRPVDAPTSLGGDRVDKKQEKSSVASSRDGSIRIGSKTLAQIREDFPILQEKIHGNPLVWLDNGATTQRPIQVIDRVSEYYKHENSNVHRGAHTLAARSTDAYEHARDIVRDFIGASSSDEIVFVRGTTEAINLVANAYVKPQLQPGDEIIVSILEHHANIVPWQLIAEETGAVIKVIPCDSTGQLILHEYEKLFTKKTKFVACTHVSNVLGTVTPVEELVAIAHRHGVRILIDGAQSVAHIPVNVTALDADFFVFSGHKIFAPTGIGVVYGKRELLEAARPYHGGGNMILDVTFERTIYNKVPNKFEAGTGSIADAIGLGAALQYLIEIGMPCVGRWEHELLQYAMKEMKTVKGLTLIGTALNKASVLSFKLDGYSDEEVGQRLDSYGIAVRTGHHCAQPVLRHFGLEGTIRPTLALYNSPDDIDSLVKVLKTFA